MDDSYSWKLQHLREDFRCSPLLPSGKVQSHAISSTSFRCNDYDRILRPPVSNWSSEINYGIGDCRAGSGEDPDSCCMQPKSTVSASRVYLQTGLGNVRSFVEAFGASYPIGTRVYPHSAIAVADFDGDLVEDIIMGNRIFMSSQDRDFTTGIPNPPYGDFSNVEGLEIGNREFVMAWAGDVDGVRPNDLVVKYKDGSVGVFITTHDRSGRVPGSSGVGFRWAGELVKPNTVDVTTVEFVKTIEGYGTDCRQTIDGRYDCESEQRAIFLGSSNGEDLIWTSANTYQPASSGIRAYAPNVCPTTDRGGVTLPIRNQYTCESVSSDMGLGNIYVVKRADLPKHTCFWTSRFAVNTFGPNKGQEISATLWNEGADGVEWFQHPLSLSVVSPTTIAELPDLALVCKVPLSEFRDEKPPSPPASGAGARYNFLEPSLGCGDVADPCQCCTSQEWRTGASGGTNCVPAASGQLFDASISPNRICASQTDIDANAIEMETGICEDIRPFCNPSSKSVVFSPLAGSVHHTRSSATFFLDIYNRFQGIVVGTAAGSQNALVYLSRSDVVHRPLGGDASEDAVAVSTARIAGAVELICFANSNTRVCA
ncbi:MAG: hypothetical protein CMI16_02755 [Opitutaceae bacterium]|nr:hypothetical protein [Opitutaceae bacterium]